MDSIWFDEFNFMEMADFFNSIRKFASYRLNNEWIAE